MNHTSFFKQTSLNANVKPPEHILKAMQHAYQGLIETYGDFIACNGVTWHTDPLLPYPYSALLTIRNDGFNMETRSKKFPCAPGDLIILNHMEKHRLKATSKWHKGMFWAGLVFEIDEWPSDNDLILIEKEFAEILSCFKIK